MAGFDTGEVVGDRFVILGVLGRGGTATVYLADDRLRKQRVALKVVHEHLSADASTRRRLDREVQSASLLRHDAALVPHDVHELEGRLALSMPYHAGHTLEERVSEQGALPIPEVRRIGVRLAGALMAAHRAGVLHRDVTAGNVLLSEGGHDTALTDFGLARLRNSGTRSTTMLGTAGYAAPEVYAGQRADPRSDLYGLGAVLYLAATGQPAFDARDPMSALRRQLDGVEPVRSVRPEVPEDLAAIIEALLAPEPEDRPTGARDVLDALEGRAVPAAREARPAVVDDGVVRQYLPPGEWTVVVREHPDDRGRRDELRVKLRRVPSREPQWARELGKAMKSLLGFEDLPGITPEEALANAVAEEAGLRPGSLELPGIVYNRRFRLVDGTDTATAHRLAEGARAAGFRARPVIAGPPRTPLDLLAMYFWVPIAVGWSTFPFVVALLALIGLGDIAAIMAIPTMIALSIILPVWSAAHRGPRDSKADHLPIAWRASLAGLLKEGEHAPPQYAIGVQAEPSTSAPAPRPPDTLRDRVEEAIASLTTTIEAPETGLSVPEQHDLRSTAKELRQTAKELADEVDRLKDALVRTGAPEGEIAVLERRLSRLRTRRSAGEVVDDSAIASVEQAIAQHEADLAMEAELEARLAASTAQLLEIASTASKVQRQIVLGAEGPRAAEGVERLQREVAASEAARREAAARQAVASGR